jgi:hypothetical protein
MTDIDNTLVPGDDGTFIEIGPDGTPLGEWHWDPVEEEWIFEEYPPLGDYPPTGDSSLIGWVVIGGVAAAGALAITVRERRKKHR